jgi:hypothetical protein
MQKLQEMRCMGAAESSCTSHLCCLLNTDVVSFTGAHLAADMQSSSIHC